MSYTMDINIRVKSWFSRKCAAITAKNTVISPDFLVRKFCGKAQFPHSFGRFPRNYAETVPFSKISTPGNQVNLRYFSQWISLFCHHLTTIRSKLFKFLSSNSNLDIRSIRQSCIVFASAALVSEKFSRSVESLNAATASHYTS